MENSLVYFHTIIVLTNVSAYIGQMRGPMHDIYDAEITRKLRRCNVHVEIVAKLDHLVLLGCLKMCTTTTDTVCDLLPPRSQVERISFSGRCKYFGRFLPDFARFCGTEI